MIGREDLDECPKCHNTAIQYRHQSTTGESVTYTALFCDCPMAKRYYANLRASITSTSQILRLLEAQKHLDYYGSPDLPNYGRTPK